ncbi:MAG: hypothetical protein AAGU77_13945, partial [Bacillota bacterium]
KVSSQGAERKLPAQARRPTKPRAVPVERRCGEACKKTVAADNSAAAVSHFSLYALLSPDAGRKQLKIPRIRCQGARVP